jgi:serine phosphatase RsbU (regulator of sigma subunit)
MGAAILMTAVQASLRAALARYGEPGQAVCDVNRYIVERSAAHMFATLWVGVHDPREGVLHVVDAGHGHWLMRRHDGELEHGPRPGGPLIGIEPSFIYAATTMTISPGDRIVLYSDGVVEHRDPAGDEFGATRLMSAIDSSEGVEDDVKLAVEALDAFVSDAGLEDDTTIASIVIVEP